MLDSVRACVRAHASVACHADHQAKLTLLQSGQRITQTLACSHGQLCDGEANCDSLLGVHALGALDIGGDDLPEQPVQPAQRQYLSRSSAWGLWAREVGRMLVHLASTSASALRMRSVMSVALC